MTLRTSLNRMRPFSMSLDQLFLMLHRSSSHSLSLLLLQGVVGCMLPVIASQFDRATASRRATAKTPRSLEQREKFLLQIEQAQREFLGKPYTAVSPRYQQAGECSQQNTMNFSPQSARSYVHSTVTKHTFAQTIISGGDKRRLLHQASVEDVLSSSRRRRLNYHNRSRSRLRLDADGNTVLPEYRLPIPVDNPHEKGISNSPLLRTHREYIVETESLPKPSRSAEMGAAGPAPVAASHSVGNSHPLPRPPDQPKYGRALNGQLRGRTLLRPLTAEHLQLDEHALVVTQSSVSFPQRSQNSSAPASAR
jgi:hypothetical protein